MTEDARIAMFKYVTERSGQLTVNQGVLEAFIQETLDQIGETNIVSVTFDLKVDGQGISFTVNRETKKEAQ